MNAEHDYNLYRDLAERARQNRYAEFENAIILIKNQEVQGWCTERPNAGIETGLIAVDAGGRVYIAQEGEWKEKDAQLSLPLI